jgi:hypothetical protein
MYTYTQAKKKNSFSSSSNANAFSSSSSSSSSASAAKSGGFTFGKSAPSAGKTTFTFGKTGSKPSFGTLGKTAGGGKVAFSFGKSETQTLSTFKPAALSVEKSQNNASGEFSRENEVKSGLEDVTEIFKV